MTVIGPDDPCPHRNPDGPGFIGIGTFPYKVEYGTFRPSDDSGLCLTCDYPEEALEWIDRHPGYRMAVRRVPTTPEWEFI